MRPREEGSGRWRVLGLWALAFVLHRGALLALGFDGVFYWEETYRLLVAEALLHGWSIPLVDLQADPYAGGSLVMGVLAIPVVAAGGFSVVGLKCVALAWSAAGFAAWLALVDRYFGPRAAHVFGLSVLAAPPLFLVYNLVAMGSHAEAATLIGVELLLAYRVLYDGRRSAMALAAWGAWAGAATWFTYVSAVPFAVCVLVALAARALPPRRWPALALGFLAGLAPWLAYNAASGGRGLGVVVSTFAAAPLPGTTVPATPFGARLLDLLVAGLPAALEFHDAHLPFVGLAVSRRAFAYPCYAMLVAGWSACAWRWARGAGATDEAGTAVARSVDTGAPAARARPASDAPATGTAGRLASDAPATAVTGRLARPELPLLLLTPVFVLLIAASNQIFDEDVNRLSRVPFLAYRVLVPALPAMLVTLALAVARLRGRAFAAALGCIALLGGVASARVALDGAESRPRIEEEARALGANAMGQLLHYKHGPDPALATARIEALDPDLRPAAYQGFGFALAYHHPATAPVEELLARVRAFAPAARADVVTGMRTALGPGMEQVAPVADRARARELQSALGSLDDAG